MATDGQDFGCRIPGGSEVISYTGRFGICCISATATPKEVKNRFAAAEIVTAINRRREIVVSLKLDVYLMISPKSFSEFINAESEK